MPSSPLPSLSRVSLYGYKAEIVGSVHGFPVERVSPGVWSLDGVPVGSLSLVHEVAGVWASDLALVA
jgi:hypothetical protein